MQILLTYKMFRSQKYSTVKTGNKNGVCVKLELRELAEFLVRVRKVHLKQLPLPCLLVL